MNKICVLYAAAMLIACGKHQSSPSSTLQPTYTPAAQGSPVGSPVTATLDSSGGTIASDDSRLEVTIPAGVLGAATEVTVQTLTNTSPNGLGPAYRLAPDGTTFAQPITLTFHLNDLENGGIDSTFIATQHADGLWYSQPNLIRDSTAQTVSVDTNHFSDWTVATELLLTPQKTRARTGTVTSFTATVILSTDTTWLTAPNGEENSEPDTTTLDKLNYPREWSVNSIAGGNTTFGQISDPGAYTAPTNVPNPNAVTVQVMAQVGSSEFIARAEADIYAQEIWSGSTDVTQIDGTKIHAEVTFAQKIEASGSETMLNFTVQSGTVHITAPATNPAGCAQTVAPVIHSIGPNDGSLSVTYDLATGPEDATVTGGGTTAWAGTYTEACANGTQTVESTVVAQWWPINAGQQTSGLTAQNGVLDGTIGNLTASGTIHLVRE